MALQLKLRDGQRGSKFYVVGSLEGQRINRSTGFGPSEKRLALHSLKSIEREVLKSTAEQRLEATTAARGHSLRVKTAAETYFARPGGVGATTAALVSKFAARYPNRFVVDIMPIDVINFFANPKKSGPTLRREINAVQGFLNYIREGYNLQPLRIKKPANNPPRNTRFDEAERARALAVCEDIHPWFVPHLMFYFLTGVRRTELCKLTWGDITFEGDEPAFVSVSSRKGARGTVINRKIAIHPDLKPVLRAMRMLRRPKPEHRVFFSKSGKPINSSGLINKALKDVTIKAKILGRTPHDTRRTFGTELLSKEVPDLIITDLLGHVDKRMLSTYAIVGDALRRSAVEKISSPTGGQ